MRVLFAPEMLAGESKQSEGHIAAPAPQIDSTDSPSGLTGRSKRGIHLGDGILLHPRHDVAVEVESDADLGMAQAFTGDLGMDARGQQMRRVGVA